MGTRGQLGIALFCLGFPEKARTQIDAGIVEASALAHPPSLVSGLALGCRVLSLGGDNTALDEWAHELIAVTTEQYQAWAARQRAGIKQSQALLALSRKVRGQQGF